VTDKELARVKHDFRLFLKLVWDHINLPSPTPVQYDIARYIQRGPKKKCVEAFRGVGKSFITSAYVLWYLLNDPQRKVLVVSASKARADAFSTFTLRLIEEMPILAHLKPLPNQRQSRIEFDVGPATADQSPSVKSAGITGQITGSRADLIVADDVEVPNNSATADMREKLIERIKEFSAILKPLPHAETLYLGTPQTEDSIYNKLPGTFETRIWPARVPANADLEKYGQNLAPYVAKMCLSYPEGSPVDPDRFSDWDLAEREAEYGKSGFSLQFMLNTQLSDMERYPLKIKDFIVMDTDPVQAPMVVNWLPNDQTEIKKVPNLAMAGDRFYGPAAYSKEFSNYTGSVMSIDPSGRGKDETAFCVLKMLNGFLYIRRLGGFPGGYETATLRALATIAKEEGVNRVIPEANFGDGMFTELIKPVFAEIHPCQIEEVKSTGQKEKRIIDVLEPLLNRHKLILDRRVIEDDYRTAQAYEADNKFNKTLVYQLTRISQDKGSLKHDDRLDALAIACAYWVEKVGQNELLGLARKKDDLLKQELERFMVHAKAQNVKNRQYKVPQKPNWASPRKRWA
jgi:hypothetical protein